ncbi:MarR family transcriptional regulator [Roseovarius aquimarinus]|uniref:MarR family transcriptional regulator n=1 Tax=Roseovarius aquimarinus TaxID=1229156 RepID=A0ABW7I669_9RHOB
MTTLSSIARLRSAMLQMERDLGLSDLSHSERDVLYAFHNVASTYGNDEISSDAVKQQLRVTGMKHATFHRALRKLLDLGLVLHAEDSRAKFYKLPSN